MGIGVVGMSPGTVTGEKSRSPMKACVTGATGFVGANLMGQDWRFSSRKAREELGYDSRPLDDTLQATIDWYLELIEAGAFADSEHSGLSRWADSMRIASRLGLLTPLRVGQRVIGRRMLAGG